MVDLILFTKWLTFDLDREAPNGLTFFFFLSKNSLNKKHKIPWVTS